MNSCFVAIEIIALRTNELSLIADQAFAILKWYGAKFPEFTYNTLSQLQSEIRQQMLKGSYKKKHFLHPHFKSHNSNAVFTLEKAVYDSLVYNISRIQIVLDKIKDYK